MTLPTSTLFPGPSDGLDRVLAWLSRLDRPAAVGVAIRSAIDFVLDGARTGRYSVDQLQTSEKIYVGNRVEHSLLYELGLRKMPPLDSVIDGVPVDIKFTLNDNWMIPPEAFRSNAICILAAADDEASRYRVGVFRAVEELLNAGNNRDAKRSVSMRGRELIRWLPTGPLPENFLLRLPSDERDAILEHAGGQAGVTELFRRVQSRPVPRVAVETIARQLDAAKRVRDARLQLAPEGIAIFNKLKQSPFSNDLLAELGRPPLRDGFWMSETLPPRYRHLLENYNE